MTYQEAQEKLFKVRWKTEPCFTGEDCWCRMIIPEETIPYTHTYTTGEEVEENIYIVGAGAIDKEIAEYFVKLHNESL